MTTLTPKGRVKAPETILVEVFSWPNTCIERSEVLPSERQRVECCEPHRLATLFERQIAANAALEARDPSFHRQRATEE